MKKILVLVFAVVVLAVVAAPALGNGTDIIPEGYVPRGETTPAELFFSGLIVVFIIAFTLIIFLPQNGRYTQD